MHRGGPRLAPASTPGLVERQRVREEASRSRRACPPGSRTASTRRTNPGRNRSVLGASARKNDGMPIVSGADQGQVPRQEREHEPGDARGERDQHRVDGLRQVQARASARCCRARAGPRPPPAAARRRSSRAARAAPPRASRRCPSPSPRRCPRPSARGVVHAVAGHRHRVAARPAARAPSRASAAGVTRPKTACVSSTAASSSLVVRSSRASTGLVGARQARAGAAIAPTVAGWSPEMHLHRHALLGEVRGASPRRRAAAGRPGSTSGDRLAGRRGAGRPSSAVARPASTTRACPAPPRPRAAPERRVVPGVRAATSGAPRTHAPCSPNAARAPLPRATRTAPPRVPAHSRRRVRTAPRSRSSSRWARIGRRERGERRSRGILTSSSRLDLVDGQSVPSVSVPVLSMQSTSTRARPSTAGSSCTSTRLLRQADDRRRRTRCEVSSTSPSGTIATVPATAPDIASRQLVVRLQLAPEQQRGRRHDRERHVHEDPVDAGAELRPREGEAARLLGQPHGVGVARRRRSRGSGAGPAATNEPDSTSSPGRLADGVGLAGEERLVDLERRRRSSTSPSTTICVAGAQRRARRRGRPRPTRDLARRRRRGRRGPSGRVRTVSRSSVRFARSSCTMPIAVFAIEHEAEERVLDRSDHQDDRRASPPRSALNRVKTFARTICATVRVGARGHVVDLAARDAFGDLGRRQPARRSASLGRLAGSARRPSRRGPYRASTRASRRSLAEGRMAARWTSSSSACPCSAACGVRSRSTCSTSRGPLLETRVLGHRDPVACTLLRTSSRCFHWGHASAGAARDARWPARRC